MAEDSEVTVDFENGAHMVVLAKLADGSAVKRVQVEGEVFVREAGGDVKHAYDRGWIAGWNAHGGGRVPGPIVIGPPGTDPGDEVEQLRARTIQLWDRLSGAGLLTGGLSGIPLDDLPADAAALFIAAVQEVTRG